LKEPCAIPGERCTNKTIMKNKRFIILLISLITLCGIQSKEHTIILADEKVCLPGPIDFQDSLKLLDFSKVDYGFNKDISLWGTQTYDLYKNKITRSPGGPQELKIKSKNAHIGMVFNETHEIEKIVYYSLR